MHELLLLGAGTALAGSLATLRARAVWLRRRRLAPIAIGERAPALDGLVTPEGQGFDPTTFRDGACVVVVFMSNACPGVKAYDGRLKQLHSAYAPRDVRFVGVNAVDERNYPGEDVAGMAQAARDRRLPFPYLKDSDQNLARAFGAYCTPYVFVLDGARRLRYRGRIDDALVTTRASKHHLRDALDDILAGHDVRVPEVAPLGCVVEFSRPRPPIDAGLWTRMRGILAQP